MRKKRRRQERQAMEEANIRNLNWLNGYQQLPDGGVRVLPAPDAIASGGGGPSLEQRLLFPSSSTHTSLTRGPKAPVSFSHHPYPHPYSHTPALAPAVESGTITGVMSASKRGESQLQRNPSAGRGSTRSSYSHRKLYERSDQERHPSGTTPPEGRLLDATEAGSNVDDSDAYDIEESMLYENYEPRYHDSDGDDEVEEVSPSIPSSASHSSLRNLPHPLQIQAPRRPPPPPTISREPGRVAPSSSFKSGTSNASTSSNIEKSSSLPSRPLSLTDQRPKKQATFDSMSLSIIPPPSPPPAPLSLQPSTQSFAPPSSSTPIIGMMPDPDPKSKHGAFVVLLGMKDMGSGDVNATTDSYVPNPACTIVLEQLPKACRNVDWVRKWARNASAPRTETQAKTTSAVLPSPLNVIIHLFLDAPAGKALIEFSSAELARRAWNSPKLGRHAWGLTAPTAKGKTKEDQIKAWWYRVDGVGAGDGVGEIEEGEIEEGEVRDEDGENGGLLSAAGASTSIGVGPGKQQQGLPKETKKQRKARLQREREEKRLKREMELSAQYEAMGISLPAPADALAGDQSMDLDNEKGGDTTSSTPYTEVQARQQPPSLGDVPPASTSSHVHPTSTSASSSSRRSSHTIPQHLPPSTTSYDDSAAQMMGSLMAAATAANMSMYAPWLNMPAASMGMGMGNMVDPTTTMMGGAPGSYWNGMDMSMGIPFGMDVGIGLRNGGGVIEANRGGLNGSEISRGMDVDMDMDVESPVDEVPPKNNGSLDFAPTQRHGQQQEKPRVRRGRNSKLRKKASRLDVPIATIGSTTSAPSSKPPSPIPSIAPKGNPSFPLPPRPLPPPPPSLPPPPPPPAALVSGKHRPPRRDGNVETAQPLDSRRSFVSASTPAPGVLQGRMAGGQRHNQRPMTSQHIFDGVVGKKSPASVANASGKPTLASTPVMPSSMFNPSSNIQLGTRGVAQSSSIPTQPKAMSAASGFGSGVGDGVLDSSVSDMIGVLSSSNPSTPTLPPSEPSFTKRTLMARQKELEEKIARTKEELARKQRGVAGMCWTPQI